jgi:hypothetical protein
VLHDEVSDLDQPVAQKSEQSDLNTSIGHLTDKFSICKDVHSAFSALNVNAEVAHESKASPGQCCEDARA